MVEKTLKKIRSIEDKAALIIEQARRDSSLSLIKTRERHEAELSQAAQEAGQDLERLIRATEEAAQAEAKEIGSQSKKQIKETREKALPKITSAKKEILRCLS